MRLLIRASFLLIASLGFAACDNASDGEQDQERFSDYKVEIEHSGDLLLCQVVFMRTPPDSDLAAKIMREAVEDLVEKDGDREILAMAFNRAGEALPENHYGGVL